MPMPAALKPRSETARAKSAQAEPVHPDDAEFLQMLGKRVRSSREGLALSRRQLAEVAEVSERYLAQLELGAGNASITLLRRVARALGVRLTELLGSSERREQHLITRFLDGLSPERLNEVLQRLVHEFGAEESVRRKRIALIGLRGAGKSTLGAALAKHMRRPFVELDREIEQELAVGLSEIFLLYGQPGYRKAERRCLDRIIGGQGEVVISVGGGVVSEPETFQKLLTNCYTIWVKASPTEHMSRVIAQGDMRPMKGHAQAMQDLKNILSARTPEYARADAIVDTSGKSIEKSLAALKRVAISTE
jgi:XRE family aerobic/anaerobic benzoate catabolism transcriptional regulator